MQTIIDLIWKLDDEGKGNHFNLGVYKPAATATGAGREQVQREDPRRLSQRAIRKRPTSHAYAATASGNGPMQRTPILTYGGSVAGDNERALFQRLLTGYRYSRTATSGTKDFKAFEAKWNSLVAEVHAGAIIGLPIDSAMEGVTEKSHQDLQTYYGEGRGRRARGGGGYQA